MNTSFKRYSIAAELLTSVVYQQYMPTEIQPRYKTSIFAQGIEWTGDRLRSRANAVVNGSRSPVHLSMDRKRHLHQAQGVDGGFCFSTDVIRIFCFKSVWHLWIYYFSADVRQILCYPRHCIVRQKRDGDLVGKMVNVEIHQAGIGNRILYASLLD